jgi:hypothetical protein
MKLVKQQEPGQCLAACVAMLCNVPIETVLKSAVLRCHPQHRIYYYHVSDAIKFLANFQFQYGLSLGFDRRDDLSVYQDFTINYLRDLHPAVITTPSPNYEGATHCVVWDNVQKVVHDPLKDAPASLDDYQVLEWTPVSPI